MILLLRLALSFIGIIPFYLNKSKKQHAFLAEHPMDTLKIEDGFEYMYFTAVFHIYTALLFVLCLAIPQTIIPVFFYSKCIPI